MLGKTGSLHNLPAPSASVLNEALKLLATFGDSKSLTALLGQVREVQGHNEQVFREAQDAIAELTRGQKELDESRKALAQTTLLENGAIKHRAEELSQAEARLSGRIAKFDQEQSIASAALSELKKVLYNLEQTLEQRKAECESREEALARRTTDLDKIQSGLSAYSLQLEGKERKLRAALDGQ